MSKQYKNTDFGGFTTTVKTKDFAKTHANLISMGYSALPCGFRDTNETEPSLAQSLNAMMYSSSVGNDGKSKRSRIPVVFSTNGSEVMDGCKDIGTPNLGYMEWGLHNSTPNIVAVLTKLLPYTAAGWNFNTKLCAGLGPEPMYHYTQYVGGNITTKDIPFADAGILLQGRLLDLLKQKQNIHTSATVLDASASGNISTVSEDSSSDSSSFDSDEVQKALDEQIKELRAAIEVWKSTCKQIEAFCENNNLQHTYLSLCADMILFEICYPELQLNKEMIDENGNIDRKAIWKPQVKGVKHRSVITTRKERMDRQGHVNYVYISNAWLDNPIRETGEVSHPINAIPALNPDRPVPDLRKYVREDRMIHRNRRRTRFVLPSMFASPGNVYYPQPSWWSIFSGDVYEYVATMIEDRNTRKKNSNIIGRVIYIHQGYLEQVYRQLNAAASDPELQKNGNAPKKMTMEAVRDKLYSDINSWLANPNNAGQSLLAYTFTNPSNGNETKSFEIVEIESNSKQSADANQKELMEVSAIIFFAMGLDAKLVGNVPGDTSSGGGTDLRERYLLKQIQMAPTQSIVLRFLDVLSKFNGWDSHLRWQVKREVLTTLDNSKTGITSQENS